MKRQSRHLPALANARGVTYLLTMMAIVLIGISITVAGKQWKTMVQREKEADLLAHGIEIQSAIAAYYEAGKVQITGPQYPPTLEQLTKVTLDSMNRPKRFLRKVYTDPITRGDWDYIPGPRSGIMGVRSKSSVAALKQHGFPPAVRHFEGLVHYNEWVFQHPNSSSAQSQPQGQPGIGPQGQPGMGPVGQPGMGPQGQPGIGLQGQPRIGPQGFPSAPPGFPPPPPPPPGVP
jgi:type II secretory pathway pseudopilin PulG